MTLTLTTYQGHTVIVERLIAVHCNVDRPLKHVFTLMT